MAKEYHVDGGVTDPKPLIVWCEYIAHTTQTRKIIPKGEGKQAFTRIETEVGVVDPTTGMPFTVRVSTPVDEAVPWPVGIRRGGLIGLRLGFRRGDWDDGFVISGFAAPTGAGAAPSAPVKAA